jgi:hypothetical protein
VTLVAGAVVILLLVGLCIQTFQLQTTNLVAPRSCAATNSAAL